MGSKFCLVKLHIMLTRVNKKKLLYSRIYIIELSYIDII